MALYREDKRAAMTGMVVGTAVLGAIVYGLVLLTNMKYAGESHGAPPAATKQAPAAGTH